MTVILRLLGSFLSSLFLKLISGTDALFNRHKFVRRSMMFWACGMITWATFRTFQDPYSITGDTVSALATVTALLTAVIGFYQWSRNKEDGEARKENRNHE